MFYHIKGELELLGVNFAVIEAGGVGYRLFVSDNTRTALARIGTGKTAKLLTHLSVRDDGVELFGFYTPEELNVFRLLITVSGVGPKVAMAVLSYMTPEKLAVAVSSEDKKSISKAPGVGPKTAARIILELKDKLKAETAGEGEGENTAGDIASVPSDNSEAAVEALRVLGFSRGDALRAIAGCEPGAGLEDIIRFALKKLN
ncbi:MAG: Holliday junction branch migration protein RuvA [Clostridia bacterium]|nr:Holliday junction branch migration protein RuvA [Clostridia bacterium]